jgi:hypothetical protein
MSVKRRPDIIPGMVAIGVAFVATIVLASAVQQCRARRLPRGRRARRAGLGVRLEVRSMSDNRPSIAELKRFLALRSVPQPLMAEIQEALPALLEIADAAKTYWDAQCDSAHCDRPAHRGGCAILKAGRRMSEALAKVRP